MSTSEKYERKKERRKIQIDDTELTYNKYIYYIDADEIPGFLLLLKIISSPRAVNISLSFTSENIGVVMVTNTVSQ